MIRAAFSAIFLVAVSLAPAGAMNIERVVSAGGESVAVELRPSGREAGSGSQISLAALRALGLSLTQLAPLTVYALD